MTPVIRISLGLVTLTVSILLAADTFVGIFPDQTGPLLEARKRFCESLAAQYSSLIERGDVKVMQQTMASLVERTPDVLSVGLRSVENGLLASTPGHLQLWAGAERVKSTPTHAQVPIFHGSERWGTVEVRFTPLPGSGVLSFWDDPLYRLIVIVVAAGFAVYFLFMRRTLRYLDPATVVPGRVRAVLDQLVEGAVLLDDQLLIVLTNTAFAEMVGRSTESLTGTRISELDWRWPESSDDRLNLPWDQVKHDGHRRTDVRLELQAPKSGLRIVTANVSPIVDGDGKQRGVLATFDDISELERTNRELRGTVERLETAQAEIRRQNQELNRLATEDPLTGCLNRRAFFEKLESEFEIAKRDGLQLSCIMTDIDFFKSINDSYGHAAGDSVIKEMASVLTEQLGTNDAVGRYGGEEFCMVLTATNIDQALALADRAREEFQSKLSVSSGPTSGKRVTASFGVSSINFGAPTPDAMVDEADQALYESKSTGRNRVTVWRDLIARQAKAG